MTESQIRQAIRKRVNGSTLTDVAKQLSVSVQYLHDVVKNRRKPGRKLLKGMGLERKVDYVAKEGSA